MSVPILPGPDKGKLIDFTGIENQPIQLSDRLMTRDPNGSLHSSKPKRDKPINWKEEADRRGNRLIAVVEERKKIQELILECCIQLENCGFECEAGSLSNCDHFMQLKAFARGVPHITRPRLEEMPLSGMRAVKRVEAGSSDKPANIYLNCGHILEVEQSELEGNYKLHDEAPCPMCMEMLNAKGILEKSD